MLRGYVGSLDYDEAGALPCAGRVAHSLNGHAAPMLPGHQRFARLDIAMRATREIEMNESRYFAGHD